VSFGLGLIGLYGRDEGLKMMLAGLKAMLK
jgi:hypothetical protein